MAPTLEHPAEEDPVQRDESKFNAEEYLKRTLPRQPGDMLKVCPMHGRQSFRVNWYNIRPNPKATIPGLGTAYIVRESKFLYCHLNAGGTPEITYPAKQ